MSRIDLAYHPAFFQYHLNVTTAKKYNDGRITAHSVGNDVSLSDRFSMKPMGSFSNSIFIFEI